jgi:enoyl-CoA hydratase
MVRAAVAVEHTGPVAIVTIDRPERRNALDHSMIRELLAIQAELHATFQAGRRSDGGEAVRVVVVTGAPPAFSAGADVEGVEPGEFVRDLTAMLRGFGTLPVPVVAAVDGPALGAGAQLAVAADLRIATPGSTIGVPAAKLGLAVDRWTVARLASEFGPPVARAMLLGAEVYDGARLHALGGIHRLGDLDAAVAWAHDLARLAPLTIAAHKLALESAARDGTDEAAGVDAARALAWASADAIEGRSAFLERRSPEFTGR